MCSQVHSPAVLAPLLIRYETMWVSRASHDKMVANRKIPVPAENQTLTIGVNTELHRLVPETARNVQMRNFRSVETYENLNLENTSFRS